MIGYAIIDKEIYGSKKRMNPIWKDVYDYFINRRFKVFAEHENGEDYIVDYTFPDGSNLICKEYLILEDA